ncbi:MAG: bifunctional hydroxymethylpyrimidine kinase/phosphomethylpyrimidine kinase [Acidobacteriota bacterium]
MTQTVPRALTIAGSDSGAGAGIQADLKTFSAYRVYGAVAITALTAQNSCGVADLFVPPAEFVRTQIDAVCSDIGVDAAKTGMLANAQVVEVVVESVQRCGIDNLVVDPVMLAKAGDRLLAEDALELLRDSLLPLACCITPNLSEAEALTGEPVCDVGGMRRAARSLCRMGAKSALVKGGHLRGDPVDVFCEEGEVRTIAGVRVETRHDHGTGCTLSAAIAAGLAKGWPLAISVEVAKGYVERALQAAPGLGSGHGPLQHLVAPPEPNG